MRTHAGVLRRLFGRKRQAVTLRALMSAGLQNVIEPMESIYIRNERTGLAYIPGRLACNVVHFLPSDEDHSTVVLDDPRLGWRETVQNSFFVRRVPGIAAGIFKPPHVVVLSAQLRSVLDPLNGVSTSQVATTPELAPFSPAAKDLADRHAAGA